MSSDRIQLPDFLIADLYKNALVEIENIHEPDQSPPPKSGAEPVSTVPYIKADDTIKYLGQNEKNIIVIVNSNEAAYLNDSDLQFLTNILKACSFNLGDIAIINTDIQLVTFNGLKETLAAKYLLLFGIEPTDIKLPFDIPLFQVQQYAGCTIVVAPPLTQLNAPTPEGKLGKSKLWLSLQRCFGIAGK